MCLLIFIRGVDEEFPMLVASNRDENRRRKAGPPGLVVGEQHRMLAPRDRRSGGSWMGVNDASLFAAITNLTGTVERDLGSTRGSLPLVALDCADTISALAAVRGRIQQEEFNPFQLLVASRHDVGVLLWNGKTSAEVHTADPALVLSNRHGLGELEVPDLALAIADGLVVEQRLEILKSVLLDTGEVSGHPILKKGGEYGTVSSSILAIPPSDLLDLEWWYAAGPPDESPYRNYGNLAKRLL